MNRKNLSLLVLVLATLSAITWFIKRPSPPPGLDPRTGERLISREILADARTITLTKNGVTVHLSTEGEENTWAVEDYYDLPVDFSKLSNLAQELQDARIVRLVTRNPERMERLDLGSGRLSITTGGNLPAFDLEIGKAAEAGGSFVRFGEEDRAYLTDLNLYLDTNPKNWARARLLEFSAEDVAEVKIGFPDDEPELVVRREDAGADWEVVSNQESAGLKSRDLTTLLNRFTSLRFTETDDFESEESLAALENSRPLEIMLFDGTAYTIRLGRRPAPPTPVNDEDSPTPPPPAAKPGPVYVFIESNRDGAEINALMDRRSFQISDYTFTSLPANAQALLEPITENVEEVDQPEVIEEAVEEAN